jgi:hypothetical protein
LVALENKPSVPPPSHVVWANEVVVIRTAVAEPTSSRRSKEWEVFIVGWFMLTAINIRADANRHQWDGVFTD